jgi:CRISPR-associated protein Cas6
MLPPAANLYSRLVVIKGFLEPEPFLEAAQRQLDSLNIKGIPYLVQQTEIEEANRGRSAGTHSPVLRRTLRIRDKEIVGFALAVEGLSAEESVMLQEHGIGGRRRFGCGIFVPVRSFQ